MRPGVQPFVSMQLPLELRRMTVAYALHGDAVVTITTDQTLEEAARMMRDRGVTALAVIDVDSRRDPGIITEADVGRAMADEADPRKRTVRDYLTLDVIAAISDWTLERAARTMIAGHFRHLMIVEEHKVIGILSMTDIVTTWARDSDEAVTPVSEGTGELPTLGPAHQYLYTLRRTAKQHRVAAKCECQWEWLQVLTGQLEDRPDLDRE